MFSILVDDYFFRLFDISVWIFDTKARSASLVELQIDTGRLLLLVNITCSGCVFFPLVVGLREFTVFINAGGYSSFSYRDGCSTGFALFLKAARSAMMPLSNTGRSVRLTKKGWSWGFGSAVSGFLSEAEGSGNLGGVLILYLSATSSKSLISSSKSKIAFSCCIASFLALKTWSLMSFSFYLCFSIFWTISGS